MRVINLTKIAEINPYRFDDSLIIVLAGDWIETFGKVPKFIVLIDDGRLILQSEECSNLRRKIK